MEKFHQLRSEKVLTTFHIKKIKNCEHLDELLTGQTTLTSVEKAILDMALERYEQTSDGWNEEELKMNFISAILMVANPNIPSVCKIFFERPLSGVINNYVLYVKTDCFVASYNEAGLPVKPYFFLQEFKKQKQNEDAEGQMLLAMLIAQADNNNQKPVYGCYLQGKNWVFTVLYAKNYCLSRQYDATRTDDLYQIIFILRALKQTILTELI